MVALLSGHLPSADTIRRRTKIDETMERISSRQNPMVRRFRALIEPSPDFVLLDGPHLLEEALASQVPIDVVAMTEAGGGYGRRREAVADRAGQLYDATCLWWTGCGMQ